MIQGLDQRWSYAEYELGRRQSKLSAEFRFLLVHLKPLILNWGVTGPCTLPITCTVSSLSV